MNLLLTSSGIANTSIHDALLGLLGKPIEESSALVIPTAIYPFPGGAGHAWEAICGRSKSPFAGLGWKSLGVLELSVLPSIDEECWVPAVQETDALLVWGGDPVFLSHWMRRSGLADVLPSLPSETVYLGVSAGSIAATSTLPRLTEIRVAAAVKRSRSPCRCRRTATTNGSRASRTGRSASSPASSTRPTKVPAGPSRAAANQTSIDWPSVVPASSSRFVNSLRRVTVARLAATGSR